MLMQVIEKLRSFTKEHLPTILALAGSAGVIATGYLGVKAGEKSSADLKEAEAEKGEPLTFAEKADITVMTYAPVVIAAAGSIFCILESDSVSRRRQASMAAAYALLNQVHTVYKDRVRELDADIDEEAQKEVIRKCHKFQPTELKEKHLYWLDLYGDYIERTDEEILQAEYKLNRKFAMDGEASWNDFLRYLHLPEEDDAEGLGWTLDDGDMIGYSWLNFTHNIIAIDDDLECCVIELETPPRLVA